MSDLLTHSRISSFKVCRRRHFYEYELGVRRVTDSKALRMGSAYHDAAEALALGHGLDAACERVYQQYATLPDSYEQLEWEYERETVLRLVCGYSWRWGDVLEFIAAEQQFQLPLLNPETGRPTPTWRLAGKIDGIVRLEDGRLAVIEHKLLGDDISADSDLWRRLRIDQQITLYVIAARRLGHHVDSVLYCVARKPTIAPTAVPILDELGAKVVLDSHGDRVKTERGVWRQTGDKERGYVLQSRPMSPTEFGEKLSKDIMERPEFYFARNEVARLDDTLREFEQELWSIQLTMREAQLTGRHYRTVSKHSCDFCSHFEPCSLSNDFSAGIPEGFVKLADVHPELGEISNDNRTTESAATVATETNREAADTF